MSSGASAENVLWGCDTEDLRDPHVGQVGAHRANMLKRDVSTYGIASAVAGNSRALLGAGIGELTPAFIPGLQNKMS